MIGFFRRSGPMGVPLLAVVAFLLLMSHMYNPHTGEVPTAGGILDNFLYGQVHPQVSAPFQAIITFAVILLSALLANYTLVSRRMYPSYGMLPALSMVLFISLFPGAFFLHAGVVLLPVTVGLYGFMLKLYNASNARPTIINMGLLAGTATLLYHPYWWMLLACYYALGQMRAFKIKEWVLLLFSFFTPAYFVLAFDFLTNQWQPSRHWPVWNPIKQLPALHSWALLAIGIVVAWSLLALVKWQGANRRMLIQVRKNWYVLLIMGVLLVPSMVFPRNNVSESLIQLSFPVGAVAAHAFMGEQKRWQHTLLFWLLVVAAGILTWAWQYYGLYG